MKANRKPTKARELSVFSPPDKFEIFFQLFFGGLTLRIETVAIINSLSKDNTPYGLHDDFIETLRSDDATVTSKSQ